MVGYLADLALIVLGVGGLAYAFVPPRGRRAAVVLVVGGLVVWFVILLGVTFASCADVPAE